MIKSLLRLTLLFGLSATAPACQKSSDCDPNTFATTCLSDGKVQTCDSFQHWLPSPYVTWNVKEYACKPGHTCLGTEDKQSATCVPNQPKLCPPHSGTRVCVDEIAIQCDTKAPEGRWLIQRCYNNHVCNADFLGYPACVSPSMQVSDDPDFEAWLEKKMTGSIER